MAQFSVFGAAGFIGSHLSAALERNGHSVRRIGRDAMRQGTALGHVIYCVGLTADFRRQATATARAHVGVLADVLDLDRFDSLLYLSSTRVYSGAADGRETASLNVQPQSPDQLYNLTKLAGEALCLAYGDPSRRVARLSNVVGVGAEPTNFLPSVVAEARRDGHVVLRTAPDSVKDYVDIDDVCRAIEAIALHGRQLIYNVASGTQTSNRAVAELVTRYLGAGVSFAEEAPATIFPQVDIGRLRGEFGFTPRPFAEAFRKFIGAEAVGQPA